MKCLTKPSAKNYSAEVESVLFDLAGLPCIQASKKLQILSVLIKEAEENMVYCNQMLKSIQTKYKASQIKYIIIHYRK